MKWRIGAVSAQIALVLYWEITEYVNLFPWNDVATLNIQTQIRDSLVNDLPKLLFIYAFIKGVRWLMGMSIGFYALWLAAILNQWLIPYLFGSAPLGWGISANSICSGMSICSAARINSCHRLTTIRFLMPST